MLEKKRRDYIVKKYKGDYSSSDFIPWIKQVCVNRFGTLEIRKVNIYFVDWCAYIDNIIESLPYGGDTILKYWLMRNKLSSEFSIVGSNNNRDKYIIQSFKKYTGTFPVNCETLVFTEPKVVDWGVISLNNLALSFISHKNYITGEYVKYEYSYDTMVAKAKYEVRRLVNNSKEKYKENSFGANNILSNVKEIGLYTSVSIVQECKGDYLVNILINL